MMSVSVPIPAAQYLRMSTEDQQYSIANQKARIREYAQNKGFNIIKDYEDPGKSGVIIKHRKGLRALLKDVVGGEAKFRAISCLRCEPMGSIPKSGRSGSLRVPLRELRHSSSLVLRFRVGNLTFSHLLGRPCGKCMCQASRQRSPCLSNPSPGIGANLREDVDEVSIALVWAVFRVAQLMAIFTHTCGFIRMLPQEAHFLS